MGPSLGSTATALRTSRIALLCRAGQSALLRALPCLLPLALGACAHTPTQADYDRGATDVAKFQRDAGLCELQAQAAMKGSQDTYNLVYDGCMKWRGYPRKTLF